MNVSDNSPEQEKTQDSPVKRTFQDSLFSRLYSEQDTLFDLYESLHPEDNNVTKDQIELITLSNDLIAKKYNDVAFLVENRLIVLAEHQSTVNLNMPLRMLFYVAGEYEKILDGLKDRVYKRGLIKIPRPEFYVVYTGDEELGAELLLSDAFREEGDFTLDLRAKVIRATDDKIANSTLDGYFKLTHFIKENIKRMQNNNGKPVKYVIDESTLEEFIQNFKGSELFREFLLKLEREEVVRMLNREYDYETECRVLREEGKAEGKAEEKMEIILNMKKKGLTIDMIADYAGITESEVSKILTTGKA